MVELADFFADTTSDEATVGLVEGEDGLDEEEAAEEHEAEH
jgi:hypothetical protein